MRADRVKVAEEDNGRAGIGDFPILEDVLDKKLCPAIGIGAGQRKRFVDGHGLGDTVNGGGGREYDTPDLVLFHALQKDEGAGDVVLVVL